MANKKSFKTIEEWLTYQRNYRNNNRVKIRKINKKWRNKTKYNWNKKHPLEESCHRKIRKALKSGILKKGLCKVCGILEQIRAHHENYKKPLKVIWFCEKHHRELHNKIRNLNPR